MRFILLALVLTTCLTACGGKDIGNQVFDTGDSRFKSLAGQYDMTVKPVYQRDTQRAPSTPN